MRDKVFTINDDGRICENGLVISNERLRLELETHKHLLWSTREAEKKVNKLADSLADEVKKNGLLNEELNQLRIENMRLKKKGGDGDMTPNDDLIKGLEQLRKGLDSFKQNLEVVVEQCNETLKRLKEEYDEYKKGYTWRYSYSENGKRYDIQRVKLGDLEKEVKRRNLKWKRIDNGGDLNIV